MANRNTAYGRGRIRKTKNKTFSADFCRGGQRLRRVFKTRTEAEAWLDIQTAGLTPLTAVQMRQATEAFSLLPEGVDLLEVVSIGLRDVQVIADAPIASLVETYFEESRLRLRPTTLATRRRHLRLALESDILGNSLKKHTRPNIKQYLQTLSTDNERRHALCALSAFYSWLISQDVLRQNPSSGIAIAPYQHKSPRILSLEQAQHVLDVAATFDGGCCLPYIALGMFAGLRPTETVRLCRENIGAEYITLSGDQTKTSSARTVAIRPNLRKILDACAIKRGVLPCSPMGFKRHLSAFIKACGIPWTPDILRHSFASYAYEDSRNAPATAFEMGHRGTDIFFQHYRGLVPPGSGAQYFSLLPHTLGNLVSTFP